MTYRSLPVQALTLVLPALLVTAQLHQLGCAVEPAPGLVEVHAVEEAQPLTQAEADDWSYVADTAAWWGYLPFWVSTPRPIAATATSSIVWPGACNLVVPLAAAPAGQLYLCFRSEVHPLGSSIPCPHVPPPSQAVWHTNVELRLQGKGAALYNLHSAVWTDPSAQVCYAIYDSVATDGPTCKMSDCVRGTTPEAVAAVVADKTRELFDGLERGFRQAGMTPQAATVAAYATAAIIVVILIAIPGPQPI